MTYTQDQINAVRDTQKLRKVPGQLSDAACTRYIDWLLGRVSIAGDNKSMHLYDRQVMVLRTLTK